MNVLQRRMFANGGPANQPLQSYQQLIASYAQKGLSVDEALVELGDPTFPKREVEKIYSSLGYSIDPSITDYQINPQNQTGVVLGQPDLDFTVDLTDVETAPENLQLDFDVPEITPMTVPEVVETTVEDLGPNEIQLFNGRKIDFSSDIDNINKGGYKSTYFLLFNSPDVKRGTNVDIALNNFVRANEPGISRLGNTRGIEERRGTAMGPMDFEQGGLGALNLIIDSLREGAEKIAPPLVDFFAGRSAAEDVRDYFEGDYLSEGFFGRSGFSKEAVDDFFTRDFASEISALNTTPTAQTVLETEDGNKIDITPELSGVNALDVIDETKDLIAEDEKQQKEEETKITDKTTQEEDVKKIPEVTYTFDADLAKEIAETPSLFQTDAFRRFIRNVGTGLVKTGQIGSGLAAGATLAAEEDRKIEEEKREALLEAVKNQKDSGLDTSLLKILPEEDAALALTIKEFEGGQSSISFLEEAIKVFEESLETGRSPTSFRGVIDKYGDQLQAFFGTQEEWDQLSPATKIDRLIEVVRQKNLQAILGESGRTISDRDREIVLSVFGDISAGTPPKVAIKKLRESLAGLRSSQREKQSIVLQKQTFLLQPEFQGRGQLFLAPRIQVINKILNTDINAPVSIDNVQTLSNLIDLYPSN